MTQERVQARRRRARRAPARVHNADAVRRKIIPARDATPIKAFLFYARNKRGKTTLCASASVIGKTLIIDCEKGTASVKRRYPDAEVFKLTTFEEIDEIYWYLATQKHGYRFVAIDPITRLGQLCMEWVLRDKAQKDLSADPAGVTQQDWGKTAELMRNVIQRYKDLPGIFLMITAYERRRANDDEEGEYDFVIGPDAQPAVKGYLMGQMDVIGRLYAQAIHNDDEEGDDEEVVVIERRMLFGPHEIYESGDRSDNLPRVMRAPTMAKILKLTNGRRN